MTDTQNQYILAEFKKKMQKIKEKNKNKNNIKSDIEGIMSFNLNDRIFGNDNINNLIKKGTFYINIGIIGKKQSGKTFFFNLIREQLGMKTIISNPPFDNGLDEDKSILLYDPIEYNDEIKNFLIKNSSILFYISKDDDYDIYEIENISKQITELENRTQFIVIHNFKCVENEFDYLNVIGTLSKIFKEFSFNSTLSDHIITYSSKSDKDISIHLGFIKWKNKNEPEINKETLILIKNIILNNTFYRDYKKYIQNNINLEITFQRENKNLKIKFSHEIKNLKVKTSLNKEKIEFSFSGNINGKEFIEEKSILYMDYPINNFEPEKTNDKEIKYELLI